MTNSQRLLHSADHRLSSPFGYRTHPVSGVRSFHNGVDYATNSKKVPCYAVSGGVVKGTGKDQYGALFVYVEFTALQRVGLYYHLDSISVKTGQTVTKDTQVGIVGTTGQSTGIHLHFSWIILNNKSFSYSNADYEDYEIYIFPEEDEMEKVYQKVKDLPAHLQAEIQQLMDAGALKGDQQGNINLTESMARSLIISKRYAENLVRK